MTTPLPLPPRRTARDVRKLRALLGLSQTAFGALLGLSRATVCRLETGGEIGLLERWALDGLAQRVARLEVGPPALMRRPLARAAPFAS